MFQHLGRVIARRPGALILAWGVAIAAAAIWSTHAAKAPSDDVGSFLPENSLLNQAVKLSRQAFPELTSHSQIVAIGARDAGLTSADFAWFDQIAQIAREKMPYQVLSPTTVFLKHRLVSPKTAEHPKERAALLIVNLPSNFISTSAKAAVEQVEGILKEWSPPAGLTVEITGTAGVGRDYAVATEQALHRTTWVTIVAVLTILVLIYRSPIGALVPLISIGACVYLALAWLTFMARFGWSSATMERIFSVVLIFGMGVDFALFWIARYREYLHDGLDYAAAAVEAMRTSGPAIFVSAATTICGLTTMLATELIPTRNAGKVLAAVLTLALLAALTLTPALARGLRGALFWPTGFAGKVHFSQRVFWPRLAEVVVRWPATVLFVGLIVLGIPALLAVRISPRYDSLSELPPGSSSLHGFEMANRYFARGQLYSNSVLLHFERVQPSALQMYQLSQAVNDRLAVLPGVFDVYGLDAPLGRKQAGKMATAGAVLAWLSQNLDEDGKPASSPIGGLLNRLGVGEEIQELGKFIRVFYVSRDPRVLRFEVLLAHPPFSAEAMQVMGDVRSAAEAVVNARAEFGHPTVHLIGMTPYIVAIRDISERDQLRIKVLASVVIAVIVFALLRDLPLTVFMLAATWLTYGATLTFSEWFFISVMGQSGLDWKLRLIVFVIIVAVGQDYNIFLVTRLMQEPADMPDTEAARRAIVRTGSVISSCGLIMAATLGSLWAGRLLLLQQVGFALALGILMDTFIVRPLLLPSFFLATHRRRCRQPAPRDL